MPLTRVYLALSSADLTDLAERRPLGPAHAVTTGLGRAGSAKDQEELEHAAWVAATEAAGALPGAAGRRRVVAAADVDAAIVVHSTSPDVPSRVEVSAPVERRRIVSFHVDEDPGASEPTDLLWYDVTELADVRALVDRGLSPPAARAPGLQRHPKPHSLESPLVPKRSRLVWTRSVVLRWRPTSRQGNLRVGAHN
jgi:hypothetical protein